MDLDVLSLAQRPDLVPLLDNFPGAWPQFLFHDRIAAALYDQLVTHYADYTMIAVDPADPGRLVAKACALPVTWHGDPDNGLPPSGYDAVILAAAADRLDGRRGNLVAAVEVVVQQPMRGRGVSYRMLEALRYNAARFGHSSLVVPVRPTRKHEHPDLPMTDYIARLQPDGLPEDPWLRVHVRAGGRIVGVAPYSMTVCGTLAEWRAWTGLPFDRSGPVRVPEALVPVDCDPANDRATYVEPNVWVHHRL